MKQPSVSVTLVTYDAVGDVRDCLASVAAQSLAPTRVRVYDNASTDGTADCVAEAFPEVELVRNPVNEGYAAAQNRGAAAAQEDGARYVFFLTPDVVLAPDHLARLVEALEADASAASAGGKLLGESGGKLDGAGIGATRARHFFDRGQGDPDDGRHDRWGDPFAPCGAAVLHRLDALEDAAVAGEILDEAFFAYKEDIDLAWRLRLRGWRIRYVPEATGRHRRAAPYSQDRSGRRRTLTELRRDRAALAPIVRRLSARNQLLAIAKNEHPRALLSSDVLRILARQAALFAYSLVFEWSTLPAYASFFAHLPGTLRRRARFERKAAYDAVRGWFG